jgi:hypothetical protein
MSQETFAEKIDRLELMADPEDSKWDLSENDRAAIRTLLESYRECVGESLRGYAASRVARCTRAEDHDGPCNGLPTKTCKTHPYREDQNHDSPRG